MSETNLILRRTERDMITNVYRFSCKIPVFLVRFEVILKFFNRFSKNFQISNFTKILPVGAEFSRVERRTDGVTDRHDEANSRFPLFCERN
jgi:hypothetical protein